jgi:hypothetical protein
MLGYLACGALHLDWGLYSTDREAHLFPPDSDWDRQRVANVRATQTVPDGEVAADVDPNPIAQGSGITSLNDSDEKLAEIYARYLLYSKQPDEMITFRAFREMDPESWQLDPKMYQYGGLFIYPIGAMVKAASLAGWVELGDETHYLQNPGAFGNFYVIGRGYVLLWGLLGLWAAYAIGRRLSDWRGGALAALLFSLMPVVVSLSHECKPHLPAAVLTLWAILCAMKYLDTGRAGHRAVLAIACGLTAGMLVSNAWIIILIPLAEFLRRSTLPTGEVATTVTVATPKITTTDRLARSLFFVVVALGVYAITNPYVAVNLVNNRDVLVSNYENSAAMYHVGDLPTALINAWTLLLAGSSIFVVIGGLVMLIALWGWDWRKTMIIAVPAVLAFVHFALFADGKPGEYARFAILPNAALGILLAAGLFRFLAARWYQATVFSIALATAVALPALHYFESFDRESSPTSTRHSLAEFLRSTDQSGDQRRIGVLREPAPYCFPAVDFASLDISLLPQAVAEWPEDRAGWPEWLLVPLDGIDGVDVETILEDGYYELESETMLPVSQSRITWANKPLLLLRHTPEPPADPDS